MPPICEYLLALRLFLFRTRKIELSGLIHPFAADYRYYEQVSAEKGAVIDRVMITKDLHGPEAYKKWQADRKSRKLA